MYELFVVKESPALNHYDSQPSPLLDFPCSTLLAFKQIPHYDSLVTCKGCNSTARYIWLSYFPRSYRACTYSNRRQPAKTRAKKITIYHRMHHHLPPLSSDPLQHILFTCTLNKTWFLFLRETNERKGVECHVFGEIWHRGRHRTFHSQQSYTYTTIITDIIMVILIIVVVHHYHHNQPRCKVMTFFTRVCVGLLMMQ